MDRILFEKLTVTYISLDDIISIWSKFHENTKKRLGVMGSHFFILNSSNNVVRF